MANTQQNTSMDVFMI